MINRMPVYNIFTQDGKPLTDREIASEHIAEMHKMVEEKRPEFEKALQERCEKDDEVFRKVGFMPQVGDICYQVGMYLYCLKAGTHDISPVRVGQIG